MIRQTDGGVIMEVRVKTGSHRFALYRKNGRLIIEITSPPREGKANLEIVKGLKRLFGKDVEIVRGLRSRDKVILIRNATAEYVRTILEKSI